MIRLIMIGVVGSLLWVSGCQRPQTTPTAVVHSAAATPTPFPLPTRTATPQLTSSPSSTPVPPSHTPLPPTLTPMPTLTLTPTPVRFAAIGDYGLAGDDAAAVATLVHSWQVDFIITLGDNNYPDGAAATIDENIGQYYADYIYPYTGQYSSSVMTNRLFPSLGNHDWYTNNAQPYLDYFTLPGNERYYDFTWGPLHLFVLDSDYNEPDGVHKNSEQAQWLEREIGESAAAWQIVYFHVAPYSSGYHGSHEYMRWPFAAWGADAVLTGHDHHYERLMVEGIPYFVNGLGGGGRYSLNEPLSETQVRYNADFGAMLITATEDVITFAFITRANEQIDQYTITANYTHKGHNLTFSERLETRD